MNKKIVAIIILAIIVIGAVIFGGYLLKKKMVSSSPVQTVADESIKSNTKNQVKQSLPVEKTEPAKPIETVMLTGTVSSITKDSIVIKNGEAKIPFPITSEISVISITEGKAEKKTVGDIKKDDEISIVINKANSSIISIQVGEGAKNAF